MSHEYEQNRASSPAAATTHNYAIEPGQSSRSVLLRKPKHAIASGLVQRKARDVASPGTHTLTEQLPDHDAPSIHQIADRGMSGTAGALPHLQTIQRSFGPGHNLSGVRGYVGGPATTAAAEMGALAYAKGDQVAFADAPSLHTAAHEAAHVVQQRAGVHLKGGIGEVGDSYEQNADAVATKVVRNESTESLLDEVTGGGSMRSMVRSDATPASRWQTRPSDVTIAPPTTRFATQHQSASQSDLGGSEPTAMVPGASHDISRVRVLQQQAAGPSAATSSVDEEDGESGKHATTSSGGLGTPWQAALEALAICNPKSILSSEESESIFGTEFGGLIFKQGGKFFFTEPMEGEEGHVDVWKALSRVPEAARRMIVGDYHTHGSGKTSSGVTVPDGEEFSGSHADPLGRLLPSLAQKGDIEETRSDVATRKEILDPKTYTAFLATPQGRFAIFIPGQNLIFSFSPNPRLLPPGSKVLPATYAH